MNNDANLEIKISAKNEAGGALNQAAGDVTNVSKKTQDLSATFTKAGIAIAAVGAGITLYAKKATDYTVQLASETKKLSRETGLATDESSRLIYVTGRLGISADQASVTFGIFSKKITETINASDPATTTLGKLHIAVQNADGSTKSFNDILLETADRFKALPDGPQKTALALDLFGRSGKDMIKVLDQGSTGIKELEKKADELGFTLNNKTITAVSHYIASQKDLKDSSNALKLAVGELTIPVLTRFNQELNHMLTTVISSSGPFRGLVANVLAFGGPVLTATGGFISFAANAATVISAMGGVRAALGAVTGFLIGPWGLAIAAAGVAVAGITWLLGRHKQATDDSSNSTKAQTTVSQELNQTVQNLAINEDRLTQATETLAGSQLEAEGASLGLERATLNYNDAVRQYGPASLEAREAHYQLEQAKVRVKEASDKVSAAQELQNSIEGRFVLNTPSAANAIQIRIDKFDSLGIKIAQAKDNIITLDRIAGAVITSVQGGIVHLQGSATQLQNQLSVVQSTAGGLQGGGLQLQPTHRASGGPVSAGMLYQVNEDGPEYFVPKSDGSIVPNNKIKDLFGGLVLNFHGPVYMRDEQEVQNVGAQLARQLQAARAGAF